MSRLLAVTVFVVVLANSMIAAAVEHGMRTATGPGNAKKLSTEQLIAKLDGPQEPILNLSGQETFVELHLGTYRIDYTAEHKDESVLLAAMLDQRRPLERRLCLAGFLLDLNNEQARQLVEQCLNGRHGAKAKQDAAFALVSEDLNWRQLQILRLLKLGARAEDYDAAWDALCRRAGELKLADAVDSLIAILRRRPTDDEAALALGEIGNRRAIPVLLNTVESNGRVQEFHMYALRDLGAPSLPDILMRHLDDYKCVEMLGDLNAKEAIEPLKKSLLSSHDEYLKSKIRLTLARLSATDRKDLAERLMQTAETANTAEERWSAIQHVSATGQRSVVARLLKIATTNTDASVVHSAIESLGELGGDQAIAGLISLFDHDFSRAPQFSKLPHDKNSTNYDVFIALALKAATGDDLGNDVQAWKRNHK
jgi:hypothetical protein